MLYTRGEIVQLCRDIAPDLAELLVALMWFASHAQTTLISGERYGLLQVDLVQARQAGFTGHPTELLKPDVNIQWGAQLLHSLGLIQFCGRTFASQIPAIMQLTDYLQSQGVAKIEAASKSVKQENGERDRDSITESDISHNAGI